MSQEIVFADDLPDCEYCGEKWCEKHGKHYWECDCIGPNQMDDKENPAGQL